MCSMPVVGAIDWEAVDRVQKRAGNADSRRMQEAIGVSKESVFVGPDLVMSSVIA